MDVTLSPLLFVTALAAGMVSFASPCVLPLVPAYLGFITGWLMIAGYVIGTVAGVVVLGPSVLAVFGSISAYAWASTGTDTALCLIMLAIAVPGIRTTARTRHGLRPVRPAVRVLPDPRESA